MKSLGELKGVSCRLIHTGQHFDPMMSDDFFAKLGITSPDVNLGVGQNSQGQDQQTASIIAEYANYLDKEGAPDYLLVVGDVTSTMACSIVAAKRGIKIGHIEAGLRSFDRAMPEEINRIVCDSLTQLFFVSDPAGIANLATEGQSSSDVYNVGNIMIDSLRAAKDHIDQSTVLTDNGLTAGEYVMLTLHRPSNVDDRKAITEILEAVEEVSKTMRVVFPIHPRTSKRLEGFGLKLPANTVQTGPVSYFDSLCLIRDAYAVLTDSGGIQEEASVFAVPCLTLRWNTERPVTTTLGSCELVGNDKAKILKAWNDLKAGNWRPIEQIPLWDGKTAGRITEIIERRWVRGESE